MTEVASLSLGVDATMLRSTTPGAVVAPTGDCPELPRIARTKSFLDLENLPKSMVPNGFRMTRSGDFVPNDVESCSHEAQKKIQEANDDDEEDKEEEEREVAVGSKRPRDEEEKEEEDYQDLDGLEPEVCPVAAATGEDDENPRKVARRARRLARVKSSCEGCRYDNFKGHPSQKYHMGTYGCLSAPYSGADSDVSSGEEDEE